MHFNISVLNEQSCRFAIMNKVIEKEKREKRERKEKRKNCLRIKK